jgi:hypothetical protein
VDSGRFGAGALFADVAGADFTTGSLTTASVSCTGRSGVSGADAG